jgi:hypothetical protein
MPAKHGRELAAAAFLALLFYLLWFQSKQSGPAGAGEHRSSLRLTLAPAAAAQQHSWGLEALTCAEQAAASQPPEKEVKRLLGHHLRPLPATDSSSPVLAASNWEGLASKEHAGAHMQLTAAYVEAENKLRSSGNLMLRL